MIQLENHHFRINGQKTFLYGAEFHYFRANPEVWQERLNQIKEAGFNLVSTYVPWLWHEFEENHFDFTGRTHKRRNLEKFLSLCNELGLYCIVRPGPYVMSELKHEGIPSWLLHHYPETLALDKSGNPHPTRVVSYLHPIFLRLAQRWYERVCHVIRPYLITNEGSVIMFQLDNEIGMLHWVTNTPDYSRVSVDGFSAYLQDRYHNIVEANTVFSTTAASFTELTHQLVYDGTSPLQTHWVWGEYRRHFAVRYVERLKEAAVNAGIDVPFIVNVHGFKDFSIYSRGTDYPIGLSQLRDVSDLDDVVIAGDFYPGKISYDNFHDLVISSVLTESISRPEQPLFSAEFQSGRLADRPRVQPQDLELITRICVSQGMNALNYYMFAGGDNPEGIGIFGRRHEWQAPIASNGQLGPSYHRAKYLGEVFNTFKSELASANKLVDLAIGFYSPYYMTETTDRDIEDVREVIQTIEAEREQFHFDGVWRLLSATSTSYNAVEIQKSSVTPKLYPILWVASTRYMDRRTQMKLVDYVKQGGQLIVGPEVPHLDLASKPCSILVDAIGAQVIGKHFAETVTAFGVEDVFCPYYSAYDIPPDAEACIVGHENEGEKSRVAGFIRGIGRGRVMVVGAAFTHQYNYYTEVITKLRERFGIERAVHTENPNLFVTERRGADGTFVSLINADDLNHSTVIYRNGKQAFSGAQIHVCGRSGKLLPVDIPLASQLVLEYSTLEVVEMKRSRREVSITLHIPANESGQLCLNRATNQWKCIDSETTLRSNLTDKNRDLHDIEGQRTARRLRIVYALEPVYNA
ncbi:beta-galactosidase [Alicyclobacillus sp. SO9]|uniref:beta-galactosidase n=1 Tax=Alicyclobacillus sp. SO9 TaxID=2665646 RepID=UPI0018E7108D|nr:beta-galactosidase [Alicyclobacillus sp. SO9]QQE79788.1 beta-galactosidase [Alicyclobacillus sp. SO9]